MLKIFNLIVYVFIFTISNSFAVIQITDFSEKIKITEFGQEVSVEIKAIAFIKEKNRYYNGWSYIFDKNLKIDIITAKILNKNFKSGFGNNTLKFEFEPLKNQDTIQIEFKYNLYNSSKSQYIRDEQVSLPLFAKNANASLEVEIPNNLVVYSLNPLFKEYYNKYVWKGTIPANGFFDIFSLTLKKAKWNAFISTTISGYEKISKIDVKIPLYFEGGNNEVKDYKITTNFTENLYKITKNEKEIAINFLDINSSFLKIDVNAILINDSENKTWISLDFNKFLAIDENLSRNLQNTMYSIMNNSEKEPLYIKLAKWVNQYIKYDKNYVGKEMETMNILKEGIGVCSHYSQLYNDLLRTAGIPSVIVSGISYDKENDKFEDHSWNLVYINGDWIPIDPTWGIYSGKLPVSHIFLFLGTGHILNYTIYNATTNNFSSNIEKIIKFVNE